MESKLWPSGMMSGTRAPRNQDELRMMEFLLANRMHQQELHNQSVANLQKIQRGVMSDVAAQVAKENRESGDPLSGPDLTKAIQQRYKDQMNLYQQQGLLPSISKPPEPMEMGGDEPTGRGSITVTGEKGPGDKYGKGTRAIQAPDGTQIIAEPISNGKYRLKARNINEDGSAEWVNKGVADIDTVNQYFTGQTDAGPKAGIKIPKSAFEPLKGTAKPTVAQPANTTQPKTATPKTNTQPSVLSDVGNVAADMFYRAPIQAIGEENIKAAGNTLADMFYRAPKKALEPDPAIEQYRMQEAKKNRQNLWDVANWMSKQVLGGLRPRPLE